MIPAKPVLHVIKIGGNVIDDATNLHDFLHDFSKILGPKILIHGGGKIATQMAKELGITSELIQGRRITNAPTLRIVTMVYAGWINKSIVASLQAMQCNAIGLSGPDGGLIVSQKRNPIPIDYGFVGDIEIVQGEKIAALLSMDLYPVFAPITADSSGQLLNTNADTLAQAIAIALKDFFQVHLTYCFEKKGVLLNPDDENSVIPEINFEKFNVLKSEDVVSAGMIPKLENALKAIHEGVKVVRLCLSADLLNEQKGTKISI